MMWLVNVKIEEGRKNEHNNATEVYMQNIFIRKL